MTLFLSLFVTAILLLLNAFFVLAEFAIVKVRASRLEELVRRGSTQAGRVKNILGKLDAYLMAVQLGITMASLGIGWVGEPAVAGMILPWLERLPSGLARVTSHSIAFGVAFLLITYLHVVLGEQAPKLIAIASPVRASLWVAAPLRFFYRLFYVPMWLLNTSSNAFVKATGFRASRDAEAGHSEQELRIILAQSQERGALPLGRLLLFENLFDFDNTTVRDVMTPIEKMVWLSLDRPWEENLAVIRASRRTRYPLCGRDPSDIKGFIHVKEILLSGNPAAPDLAALRRDIATISETLPLEKALAEMRRKRAYLALVVDRAGRVGGLLSMEDILEELVGEIYDEFESKPAMLLSEVLVPEAVDLAVGGRDRMKVVDTMLRRLAAARPAIPFKDAWESVWRREQTLSSAIGKGVAVPHGRLASLEKPVLAVGRVVDTVNWSAPDETPVRIVFLILTPTKEPGIQLRLLARLAALASQETFRENLGRAKTPKDVLDILQAFDQSTTE